MLVPREPVLQVNRSTRDLSSIWLAKRRAPLICKRTANFATSLIAESSRATISARNRAAAVLLAALPASRRNRVGRWQP